MPRFAGDQALEAGDGVGGGGAGAASSDIQGGARLDRLIVDTVI